MCVERERERVSNFIHVYNIIEGSLEVKLPTIWRDGKAEVGTVREEKRKSEKKEDAGVRKGRKWRFTVFFQ